MGGWARRGGGGRWRLGRGSGVRPWLVEGRRWRESVKKGGERNDFKCKGGKIYL